MNILLLGAGGQLGSEWSSYLPAKGNSVRYKAYGSSDLDITQSARLKSIFEAEEPDLVINCAAYTNVDKAEEEPDRARLVNATAVGFLAGLCSEWGARLIHYSTDYIFPGLKEDRKRLPAGYPEEHPAAPLNIYGQTKWEGEQAIRESGCSHLIIRVSWLCGKYGNNFIKTMLRLSEDHSVLKVVDDQWGSPSFTDNVVKNSYKLIEQEAEGTYHLSSGGLITWADFAEIIFQLTERQTEVQRITSDDFPAKARRPHFSKLNTDKIEQAHGIEPEDWRTGLERFINEYTDEDFRH